MEREKQKDRTLNLLGSWLGIGVFGRLLFTLTIIAGFVWLAVQTVQLVGFLKLALLG